jgi:putative transposase
MESSEIARGRAIEDENARMKRIIANLSLEYDAMKGVDRKKLLGPSQRKAAARALQELGVSQRAACRIARCPRSVAQYRLRRMEDPWVLERLKAIANERRRFGYYRLTIMLWREGFAVNHKRVHRIYRAHGLQLRPRRKRGVRYVRGNAIAPVSRPNERWSLDFVHDVLSNGRKFRALTIVDDFTRESIGIEVHFSLTGERVVRVLSRLAADRGLPPTLKFDNGSEFTSNAMLGWAAQVNVELHFIEPGRPMHGSVESFHGRFRDELLNEHAFPTIFHARSAIEAWRLDYNLNRPHTALGGLTPAEFIEHHRITSNSRSLVA